MGPDERFCEARQLVAIAAAGDTLLELSEVILEVDSLVEEPAVLVAQVVEVKSSLLRVAEFRSQYCEHGLADDNGFNQRRRVDSNSGHAMGQRVVKVVAWSGR